MTCMCVELVAAREADAARGEGLCVCRPSQQQRSPHWCLLMCAGQWEPKYVAAKFGDHKVSLAVGNAEQHDVQSLNMDLREFATQVDNETWVKMIERDSGGGTPYLAEVSDQWQQSAEMNQVAHNILETTLGAAQPAMVHALLWLGPRRTVTGLHSDTETMNVLHQLHGSKTVWMFPPNQAPLLYPSDKYDNGAVNYEVDPFNADLERFPDYSKASPLNVTLNAGDAIFVPYGWPHFVRSESTSLSLSGRSYSSCELVAQMPALMFSILHRLGLYKDQATCACHISSRPALGLSK